MFGKRGSKGAAFRGSVPADAAGAISLIEALNWELGGANWIGGLNRKIETVGL